MIGFIAIVVCCAVIAALWHKEEDHGIIGGAILGGIIGVVMCFFAWSVLLIPLLESAPVGMATTIEIDEIYTITAPFGHLTSTGWTTKYGGSEKYIVKYFADGELKTISCNADSEYTHLIIGDEPLYQRMETVHCIPYFYCTNGTYHHYITVPSLPPTNITKQLW